MEHLETLAHKNFPLYIVSFVVLSAGNCCEEHKRSRHHCFNFPV